MTLLSSLPDLIRNVANGRHRRGLHLDVSHGRTYCVNPVLCREGRGEGVGFGGVD